MLIRMIRNTILTSRSLKSNPMIPSNPCPSLRDPPSEKPVAVPRVMESAALFAGALEVVIRHGGREYRLRRTRLGKLILTA